MALLSFSDIVLNVFKFPQNMNKVDKKQKNDLLDFKILFFFHIWLCIWI